MQQQAECQSTLLASNSDETTLAAMSAADSIGERTAHGLIFRTAARAWITSSAPTATQTRLRRPPRQRIAGESVRLAWCACNCGALTRVAVSQSLGGAVPLPTHSPA
jgi:hypothetical protein